MLYSSWYEFFGHHAQRIGVLHQAAAHFFHRGHGRLLRRGGEKLTRAILQLPRALGGHDDEAIGALLVSSGIEYIALFLILSAML